MGNQAEAIHLGGAAQPCQRLPLADIAAIGKVGDISQQCEPRADIGDRRGDLFGRCEQSLLAILLDNIAGHGIEAGQRRAWRDRPRGQFGEPGLDGAALVRAITQRQPVEETPGQSQAEQHRRKLGERAKRLAQADARKSKNQKNKNDERRTGGRPPRQQQ